MPASTADDGSCTEVGAAVSRAVDKVEFADALRRQVDDHCRLTSAYVQQTLESLLSPWHG